MAKAYIKFQYCFLQSEHSLLMKHFGSSRKVFCYFQSKPLAAVKPNQTKPAKQRNKTQTPKRNKKKSPPQQQTVRYFKEGKSSVHASFAAKIGGKNPRSCKSLVSPTAVCNSRNSKLCLYFGQLVCLRVAGTSFFPWKSTTGCGTQDSWVLMSRNTKYT